MQNSIVKKILLAAFTFFALAMYSCVPGTKIDRSWHDPAVQLSESNPAKILLVAFMKDETNRRHVEDNLEKRLNGKGVPSYKYLAGKEQPVNEAAMTKLLRNGGFDGALVLRLLDAATELNYTPGSGAYPAQDGGFFPYYKYGYNSFYAPGAVVQDKIYRVETNLYSLKYNKLVWSAVTTSINPESLDNMVKEIADVVGKRMRSEGFLTK
jgi:hypothetical protein